jgi:hypothetical protein
MKAMNCLRSQILALALSLAGAACLAHPAAAQPADSPAAEPVTQDEEAEIREALRRIIKEDPAHARQAKKALDALDKPASSPVGRDVRNRRPTGTKRIVNGLPSRGHPAVGALLMGKAPQSASAWCTGTLVGCDKFLTAAHCIARDPSPASYLVFFQELGFFRVKSIRWEKEKFRFPYFDLAMLTLETPVEGIAPVPVNMSVSPLNNSVATIVGFGRTGGPRQDYGIKREGSVKTSACPSEWAKDQVFCWTFDAEVKSSDSAQNTCNADSGGGIFMRDKDGLRTVEKVFGVVSGGIDDDCMRKDISYNVDLYKYRDWIAEAGEGRLSSEMCGRPLWQGTGRSPKRSTVRLDADNPTVTMTIDAPDGVTALRVSMNAEDNGSGKNQFQFAAFSSKDGSTNACEDKGSGQFAFCAIDKPENGSWTISVNRKKGEGQVQITTLFVGPDR